MKKIGDITVVVGEYEKDGQSKRKYETVGALFQGDKGFSVKLKRCFNPAGVADKDGSGEIWGNVYDNSDKPGNAVSSPAKANPKPMDLDDQVPF